MSAFRNTTAFFRICGGISGKVRAIGQAEEVPAHPRTDQARAHRIGGITMSASRTARHLAAAALASAALMAAAAVPASASIRPHQPRPTVILGQIQYDSPGRDDRSRRSLNAEWVEVTNTGRHAVNLDGWTLSDRDGHTYRFENLRLDGRSTVRVHTGTGRDTRHDVYQDRRAYVWNNGADQATLRNDRDRIIDTASWGRNHH
jgi:hypothetical protein